MARTRERLSVDIDREILRNFKQVIIRKYGKLRGNMSVGVSEALELYVRRSGKE